MPGSVQYNDVGFRFIYLYHVCRSALINTMSCRVRWGIAPMVGQSAHPAILANIKLYGSIRRSNDSIQHVKDLST